ncbi:hypothetical protein JYU34_018826 [Plutella xylostella]|uniref:Uncharacterized protein n=2 Tax=Plutella xylostella TaxID=51655 RepID=A0ABQ7PYJ2_PLUXY|nr:protein HEXIM1 [Plutella xylostella]KAG7298056.1 hypothetical protein JYU34_018826 [Plutella xylostella]CAG9136330.1 unnamed protein product [Plutella xylostella]
MDVNSVEELKDGDGTRSLLMTVPSPGNLQKQKSIEGLDGAVKKKRRRGKSKRKVIKPFLKIPWPDRKRNDKIKRNRFRKIVLTKTTAPAPFNNNQFLMEIHKPEPDNELQMCQTPSTRTRDSSFSVDSEENYFYSLPEDEEDFLTKEFSSVYEDAQSERLSNMTKNDLIQEYILLEAKYENLVKRNERSKFKQIDEDKDSGTNKTALSAEIMCTDKDSSTSSAETSAEPTVVEYLQRLKEQEDEIEELKLKNEQLQHENDHLRQKVNCTSSEDSESDSSSTSMSGSSSSSSDDTPMNIPDVGLTDNSLLNVENQNGIVENGLNGSTEDPDSDYPLVNGHGLNGQSHEDNECM